MCMHSLCDRAEMLRRSSTKAASVNIKPGPNTSSERKTKLENFTKRGAELHNVPELIEEAKSTMSLKDNKSFCDDVLQVEMSGPDMPHLTLVDLPGLLEIKNDGQTEKDVELSKQLVQDYAEKPRSIILAVIEASHDHVNQAILRVAQALDPEGFRRLGIITKPDIAWISRSNVSNWVKLAKNESTPLRLGWHVLKNANGEERQTRDFDRDDEERNFFRRTPEWKTLSSDKVGIQALRPRLSQVLSEHIRNQLPELVEEIELQLQISRESIRKLGPARPSS
ncbi:MAG: hypothetical protein M1835_003759 [Candelina submexicana]|nr:MAG: hypothetical protein M1835_003759 [Candelina submexicana]